MSTFSRMKNFLLAKGLQELVPLLSDYSPNALISLMDRMRAYGIERMKKYHRGTPEDLVRRIDAANGFFEMAKRTLHRLSPATQRCLAYNAFFNAINLGDEKREAYFKKYGEYPPFFFLVSPTMACDLRCTGCYAWKYPKEKSLSGEKLDQIITEAKEDMGIYFVAITGGEPTYWPPLEEVVQKHNDCFFLMYTHGQRIDHAMAERFARYGNIYPAISIEGDEALTDKRRGNGAYKRVLSAMDCLREKGVLFGFSLTHTRQNHAYACSEEFINTMVEHGAAFGWVFQYIPVGREPDLSMVPTAQQRLERRKAIHRIRKEKPVLVYDFWNDGDAVDGCIAWGRKYVHITAQGYVEPCVFVHFAQDSIHEKSLGECLRSSSFRAARAQQPFTKDLRMPCPQIDHPHILRELVEKHGMKPTHDGAEWIITRHYDTLCQIAAQYRQTLDEDDRRACENHCCAACATSVGAAER